MPKISAGLLMYRITSGKPQVLLVHLGGPFWQKKDAGAWVIPRGEVNENEDLLAAAQREFAEETGFKASGPFAALGEVRQKSGKRIHVWAFEGDCDPSQLRSNAFEIEWPPGSGKRQEFPEVDRGQFFSLEEGKEKIVAAEAVFLERLGAMESGTKGGAQP
jgi:predicted NUDIX family NTP pyrophosphohydrolase